MDKMRTIYLVPHTHYDVAWAFSKEDYLKINEEILEEVLRIMRSSEFKFSLEQTFLLESLEERNPELWHELKEMIVKGRLEIVDGQYLMPDAMLPAGEVLIREILFGKKYCKEKFGIDVPVAWAADSFGMNAQLPQIYKKAGYKWLAFRRGAKAEITQSEFLWKGLDGTTILAHWMPLGYRAGLDLDKLDESFIELNKYASTHNILMPCGSGSMPPQPEIPQAVDDWNKAHPDIRMVISTPSQFFQTLERSGKRFEVTEGELYDDELVDVFPQVCTSRIWIVQGARQCEGLLATAEVFATLASLLGARYPAGELHQAWKKVLFVAFHDIISGCGVDEIYGEVREIFDSLKVKLPDIITRSLVHIASKIDIGGEALVVFNPLPWRMRNWVEADLELPQGWGSGEPGIKDADEVESEVMEVEKGEMEEVKSARIGFTADLPPLGYKVYRMTPRGREPEEKIKEDGEGIETPFFKVTVDKGSGIARILDKESGLLVRGNELFIDDEIGDLYRHRSRFADLIKSESGEGLRYGSFKPKSFEIERGALKWKIVFESEYYCLTWPYRLKKRFPPRLYKYKTLDIHKEVILFRDIPRIEFITKIDNKYPNIRLSIKFDTGINRKIYFRETQFGVIPEPTEHLAKRESAKPTGMPNFMNWFDLSDGTRGITFMNKGLPAVWIDGGAVYIRLLRSVGGLSADGIAGPLVPTQDALELKPYTFEYALQFHEGDWRQSEMYKKAREFDHTPLCIQSNSGGNMPVEFSFLELSPNNLVLSALKRAENGDEVVLRFFETQGVATKGEIKLFKQIKRATIVDLLEREEREVPADGNQLNLEVNPFEIVTLKLQL